VSVSQVTVSSAGLACNMSGCAVSNFPYFYAGRNRKGQGSRFATSRIYRDREAPCKIRPSWRFTRTQATANGDILQRQAW